VRQRAIVRGHRRRDGDRMTSSARLRHEHQAIERVLRGLEALAERLVRGERVPSRLLEGAVHFFAAFVDRCHHAKEEQALFPVLNERGLPFDGGPLGVLQAEHEQGRQMLRALQEATAPGAGDGGRLAGLMHAYVGLLRRHMAKEHEVLFPYAERMLSPEDDSRVQRVCELVEEREVGPGGHEALLALAESLERACLAASEAPTSEEAALAAHVMRPNLPALSPEDSLARAAELMDCFRIRELPVVERGTLVGILTERDLQPHRGHYEWTAVRAAMTPDPVTVGPDAPIATVARLLLEGCFNGLPVVAAGALVGMVGRSDLLRLLAEERS